MSDDDKGERVQLDKDTQSMIKNLEGNKKCCVRRRRRNLSLSLSLSLSHTHTHTGLWLEISHMGIRKFRNDDMFEMCGCSSRIGRARVLR